MISLAISGIITFGTAPMIRRLMSHLGVLDVPNQRSSHSIPTPRGGGLSCLLGLLSALIIAQLRSLQIPWGMVIAAIALALVGFADDRRALPAELRLAAQGCAAVVMGWLSGDAIWFAAAVVLVPSCVNVVNFMDGINGLTCTIAAIWGTTALAIGNAHAAPELAILGAVVAGAALGFLPWNMPKARLFLGDVGSYLFGGLIAAGLLIGWARGAGITILLAPLLLYVVDAGSVLLRRAARHAPLFEAHHEHVYQRLVREYGHGHATVSTLIGVASILVTLAWAVSELWISVSVTTVLALSYLALPSGEGMWRRWRAVPNEA